MAVTDAFVAGLQAFAEAIRLAANNPADAIVALCTLAQYDTAAVMGSTAIPAAMETTRAAITAAARRAALASLARACAAYQPSSYDDAVQLRQTVAPVFDAEILRAADTGDRRCYLAFKTLRAAVMRDLNQRGASLAPLTTVNRAMPLPSLVIAQQLYQDGSRAAQLLAGAGNVPCSCFMPMSFKALAR